MSTPAQPACATALTAEQRQFIAVLARIALRVARQRATTTPGATPAHEATAIAS